MYKAWHSLTGEKPRPQFFLRDAEGREYGVVEWYSDQILPPPALAALEFISADFASARPWVLFDLAAWKVVAGQSKNLPDEFFESGLDAYLGRWPEEEKEIRRFRARRASCHRQIEMAEKGYTIGFYEFFPEEMPAGGFPSLEAGGSAWRVEDQYGIRPGEFRNEVTLVLSPTEASRGEASGPPLALVNWRFGEGFDLLDCRAPEEEIAAAAQAFMAGEDREALYRGRLKRMRREGVLLGVKPEMSVK